MKMNRLLLLNLMVCSVICALGILRFRFPDIIAKISDEQVTTILVYFNFNIAWVLTHQYYAEKKNKR